MQVVVDGAYRHLTRVEADTDLHLQAIGVTYLCAVAAHGRLHGQSGVTGPHRMVLMGDRCPEQRHNAVAQDLVHRALVAVYSVHHDVQGRVKESLCLFRIKTLNQLRRALDIGKQHRDLLAFAFQVTASGHPKRSGTGASRLTGPNATLAASPI